MQSIIEPQTKPASEWIAGGPVQKVSPNAQHARAQLRVAAALDAWADRFAAGRVGTEWEFRIAPPGEAIRSLVPDVAYLSYARLGFDQDEAAQMPLVAPNVAVEIISPRDQRRNIEEKIAVYLRCETECVVLVDPMNRTVELRDSAGKKTLRAGETVVHSSLPGFAMAVADIFAKPGQR